jgi:hypothetical protein
LRGVGEREKVHQMENFKPNAINISVEKKGGVGGEIEGADGIKGMW